MTPVAEVLEVIVPVFPGEVHMVLPVRTSAVGVTGCGLIVALVEPTEIQPTEFVTVKV